MQQLPHTAYMQQLLQQQHWPVPQLWNPNSNMNHSNWMPWQVEANMHMWNMQQQQSQPQPQRPNQLHRYNHAAETARTASNLSASDEPQVVSALPQRRVPLTIGHSVNMTPTAAREEIVTAAEGLPGPVESSLSKTPMNIVKPIAPRTSTSPKSSSSKLQLPTMRVPHPQPEDPDQLQQSRPNLQTLLKRDDKHAPLASAPKADDSRSESINATAAIRATNVKPVRRGPSNTCVTRGEQAALNALAEIFPGKEFVKVRTPWLLNDRTSRAMEIDLYCHELRLGLEHSGLQHYCFPNSCHKNRAEFDEQIYRDKLKRSLCAQNGCLLLEVPFSVPHAGMKAFILSEIERLGESDN